MEKNSYISALNKIGQSIWYDNLSRDVLVSGKLSSYIQLGVSGLTSNPTIFKKAIADTNHYDTEILELATKGLSTEAICEELMIKDVAAAADLLRPVFEASSGEDGYASIEVSPHLARDTEGTVKAAEKLWRKLGRSNIMIKVPATEEGLPAIETLLSNGINVNVTLIFSVQTYELVAHAYLRALRSRSRNGETLKFVSSVASFFVSRVDSLFEDTWKSMQVQGKLLDRDSKPYLGKLGIANSKIAYASFLDIFGTSQFLDLKKEGAKLQRPLWASTGVKNPAYNPLLYVENLVGKDTVNTLPPQTLDKLLEKASIKPRITEDLDAASSLIASLSAKGINFSNLLDQLQENGVKLFADSYDELLQSIARKKESLKRY
ncbi:MAG: transaldolase [SAR324 cluster bacterium]|uniref:Transaldolase n=1 Tax=SAR324 cluster bacterium TaxID=2024889 RepID=A0A7X9FPV8_9DELT|nr:transaldolase [SAR324 cluster bacterium]